MTENTGRYVLLINDDMEPRCFPGELRSELDSLYPIIGNAEFVRAEVDGKPFDLVPHTRAAIARVTLR